jgi:hypothetical protein
MKTLVYPAFEEVTINKDGHISTKNGPSIGFIVKTWMYHKLTLSAVSEQKDCKLTERKKR